MTANISLWGHTALPVVSKESMYYVGIIWLSSSRKYIMGNLYFKNVMGKKNLSKVRGCKIRMSKTVILESTIWTLFPSGTYS